MMTEQDAALQVTQLLWKLENELDAAFSKVGKTIGFDADEYGDNHPKPPEVAGSITTMPLRVAA